MGAALGKVIKSIDGSEDAEKEIKDALNAMYALGESRNAAALATAMSDQMKVYAPIKKVLLQRQQIVASAEVGSSKLVDGVKDSVGDLMNGQILDGVTKIIGNAMNVVLGSSSGQIASMHVYALVATQLGALLRIDVDVYTYSVTSAGLMNRAKNMTAVTSIVSSVDPMQLTSGDIRAVVSLCFGNLPLAEQQEILKVVQQAWEMDRKQAIGQSLTDADYQAFQSLVRPSELEAEWKIWKASQQGADVPTPAPDRTEKRHLSEAIRRYQSLRSASEANPSGKNISAGANPKPDDTTEVIIQMIVITPPDADWFTMMNGALAGFNVPNGFTFVSARRETSGGTIGFTCTVPKEPALFDVAIRYIETSVLARIRTAKYLTDIVSHLSLQFQHPSKSGDGRPTVVEYLNNEIINTTKDKRITFIAADGNASLVSLEPGEKKQLSGAVVEIQVSDPIKSATGPGDGATGPAPASNGALLVGGPAPETGAAPVQSPERFTRFVTYEDAPSDLIIPNCPMTLQQLVTGYSLTFTYNHLGDSAEIRYTTEWFTDN